MSTTVRLALVTALVTALALVITGPAGASPTEARRAVAGKPVVGSCHDYGRRQLRKPSERSALVPCTSPHTAVTIKVLTVKRSVRASRVFARYGPRCYHALTKALGASPAEVVSTAYGVAFFRPTRKQRQQGARWLRCDAVLYGGSRLEQLPTPLLSRPITDAVARCAVGRKQVSTVCSREHTYRLASTITRRGGYPSLSRFAKIAAAGCGTTSTSKKFLLYFPDRQQWTSGVRALACLARTSR
jgi:hypothetical protein